MKKLLLILSIFLFIGAKATPTDTVFVTIGNLSKTAFINVVDQQTDSNIMAQVTNIVIQNGAPQFATVSLSSSRVVSITPVASGNGTAVLSCHVTYTDSGDGLPKSEDKEIVIYYSVTYTPPHGAKLNLTFN